MVRLGGATVKKLWTLTRGWGNEVGDDAHEIARSRRRSSRIDEQILGGINQSISTRPMKKN